MKSLREKIGEVPIFPGLKREDVAKLLDKMEECSFSVLELSYSRKATLATRHTLSNRGRSKLR